MSKDKKQFLTCLEAARGNVSLACKKMNTMSRQTYYAWMKDDPEFKQQVEDIQDGLIDFAEEKLFDLIDGAYEEVIHPLTGEVVNLRSKPNPTSVIFYLKTKGKNRGYIERQELTGKDGANLVNIIMPNGI